MHNMLRLFLSFLFFRRGMLTFIPSRLFDYNIYPLPILMVEYQISDEITPSHASGFPRLPLLTTFRSVQWMYSHFAAMQTLQKSMEIDKLKLYARYLFLYHLGIPNA